MPVPAEKWSWRWNGSCYIPLCSAFPAPHSLRLVRIMEKLCLCRDVSYPRVTFEWITISGVRNCFNSQHTSCRKKGNSAILHKQIQICVAKIVPGGHQSAKSHRPTVPFFIMLHHSLHDSLLYLSSKPLNIPFLPMFSSLCWVLIIVPPVWTLAVMDLNLCGGYKMERSHQTKHLLAFKSSCSVLY